MKTYRLYRVPRTNTVGCGKSRANSTSTSRLECLRAVNSTTFAKAAFAIFANSTSDAPAGNVSTKV